MKILFVVQNYYPSVGGTQALFQKLAEYSVSVLGHAAEVFTTDSYFGPERTVYKSIKPACETINGVTIRRFSFYKKHRAVFKFLQKFFFKTTGRTSTYLSLRITGPWSPTLKRAMLKTNADIIVASSVWYEYMTYPVWRHKTKKPKPFIFQGAIHFPNNPSYMLPAYMLNAIKCSDCYLANTTYEKDALKKMGVDDAKIKVVGVGIEISKFSKKKESAFRTKKRVASTAPVIGYVGRMSKTKSINILIDAMPLIYNRYPDSIFLFAGYDNDYSDVLKRKVRTLDTSLQANTFFEVNPPDEELIDIYHALDVLALPSLNESFGTVFLESWACHKPVVGANIGAIASVISDGIDGFLFKPDDSKDLAAKILKILENRDTASKMGAAGFDKVKANFTWEILIKKFQNACENAIWNFHN